MFHGKYCTEVRFASFLSGGFITAMVVNPPERKLTKCTSVHWRGLDSPLIKTLERENLILMTKMLKKCSTDQRFIRKRNATYKLGTLAELFS